MLGGEASLGEALGPPIPAEQRHKEKKSETSFVFFSQKTMIRLLGSLKREKTRDEKREKRSKWREEKKRV